MARHSTPLNPIHAARLKVSLDKPYFRAALYSMIPIEKPGMAKESLGPLGVDHYWRMYYDPEAVRAWTVPELATVLIHELGHLLRKHHARGEAITSDVTPFLYATDMEINDDLIAEQLPFPSDTTPVIPQDYGFDSGLLAEEYYALLQSRTPEPKNGGAGGGKSHDLKPGKAKSQSKTQDAAKGTPGPGEGNCGSCAGGGPRGYENPAPGGYGEDQHPGVSEARAELIRQATAQAIREASKSRGSIAGGWQRWAESFLSPQIPWQRLMASLIRSSMQYAMGAADYTYTRPNRRQYAYGKIIIPALRQPVPRVAVVGDTSGSMGEQELAHVVAELSGILKSLGMHREVVFLATDAQVHTTRRITSARQVELIGGGGTSMQIGIDAAARLTPKPQVCVVLTDGITTWGEIPPRGMQVIIGLIGDEALNYKTPEWARVVEIHV